MTLQSTPDPDGTTPGGKIFRGWYLVAAVFAVLTASSGVTVYSMSVYLHAFVSEGRFPITLVSFASGAFAMAGALSGAFVGRLLERHDVRRVMTAGCVSMVAAFLALPWIGDAIGLCLFYLVLGLGYGATSQIPCTTLVTRWFTRSRSTAMSIAATGNSFGAIVLVPPVAMLVQCQGLDGAAPWLALALAMVVLPLTWGVLRSWPHEVGLAPLGQGQAPVGRATVTPEAAYRAAARSRYFRGVNVAFMLGMAAHVGGQTHLFNRLLGGGQAQGLASAAIATMAFASVLGRAPAMWLLARVSNRVFMAVLLALQGFALWGCGLTDHPVALLVCIAGYGATLGNLVTSQSLILAEAFGVTAYARLYGVSRVWTVPGVFLGPGLMGLLYQQSGSYRLSYLMIGTVSLAGLIAVWWARKPPAEVSVR